MRLLERKVEIRIGYGDPDFLGVLSPLGALQRTWHVDLTGWRRSDHVCITGIKTHPFFTGLSWEDLAEKRIQPGYAPENAGAGDAALSQHYERKLQRVAEVAVQPVGMMERVRRKSVEMLLGVDAAPDAAQMAALLASADGG